jgi:hypothetical protein
MRRLLAGLVAVAALTLGVFTVSSIEAPTPKASATEYCSWVIPDVVRDPYEYALIGVSTFSCWPNAINAIGVTTYIEHSANGSTNWGIDYDSVYQGAAYGPFWSKTFQTNVHHCYWPGRVWYYRTVTKVRINYQGVWFNFGPSSGFTGKIAPFQC